MSNLQQFSNLSTWRKEILTIEANETATVSFFDTMPNTFFLINPNAARIKIGIGSMPLSDRYEYKVEQNSSEVFGRPEGTAKIYLLNDSGTKATVTLFSVNKEFDVSILKNLNLVITEALQVEGELKLSNVAEGVTVPVTNEEIETALNELDDTFKKLLSSSTFADEVNLKNILNSLGELKEAFGKIQLQTDNVNVSVDNSEMENLLNTIKQYLSNTQEEHLYNIHWALSETIYNRLGSIKNDVTEIISLLNKNPFNEELYRNNSALPFTVGMDTCTIDYIFNDSDSTLNIYKNDTIVLTVLPNEKLYNINMIPENGENGFNLKIDGTNLMYRMKISRNI